jgi:hypothetical protein
MLKQDKMFWEEFNNTSLLLNDLLYIVRPSRSCKLIICQFSHLCNLYMRGADKLTLEKSLVTKSEEAIARYLAGRSF